MDRKQEAGKVNANEVREVAKRSKNMIFHHFSTRLCKGPGCLILVFLFLLKVSFFWPHQNAFLEIFIYFFWGWRLLGKSKFSSS